MNTNLPALLRRRSLTEMVGFLGAFASRCRAQGWGRPLAHVRGAQLIAEDLGEEHAAAARTAYAAEQHDREALRLLEAAAADGLSAADMPALAAACRLIRRSAEQDRALADAFAPEATAADLASAQ